MKTQKTLELLLKNINMCDKEINGLFQYWFNEPYRESSFFYKNKSKFYSQIAEIIRSKFNNLELHIFSRDISYNPNNIDLLSVEIIDILKIDNGILYDKIFIQHKETKEEIFLGVIYFCFKFNDTVIYYDLNNNNVINSPKIIDGLIDKLGVKIKKNKYTFEVFNKQGFIYNL